MVVGEGSVQEPSLTEHPKTISQSQVELESSEGERVVYS